MGPGTGLIAPRRVATPPDDGETLADRIRPLGGGDLPPPPDPTTEPALRALWELMVREPFTLEPPALDEEDAEKADRVRRPEARRVPNGSGLGSGHVMQSQNWSGVLVAPGDPDRLRAIGAAWHVPDVWPDPAFKPLDDTWRCSTWVGLDGHFTFALSMPQLGTESRVTNAGKTRFRPWFQWWVPNTNTRPHYVANLPIAAGDRVGCYLWVVADHAVGMLFRKLDTPAEPVVGLILDGPLVDGQRAVVRGTTGEWIVERPTKLRDTAMYPLPAFDPVTFSLASAGARGPASENGARDALIGGRMIRMYAPVPLPGEEPTVLSAVRLADAKRSSANDVVVSRVEAVPRPANG